ncbi:MAG: acyl carrier protein [Clostridia bacterium]|nr:acyl carrier protein [Clostridia bacterium]
MNRNEICEKVTEIFRKVFDDDYLQINDETSAYDIEDWDSLAQITLLSEMESVFNINFNLKDIANLQNVGDMISLIEKSV